MSDLRLTSPSASAPWPADLILRTPTCLPIGSSSRTPGTVSSIKSSSFARRTGEPPRTPEERVLRVLADEPEDSEDDYEASTPAQLDYAAGLRRGAGHTEAEDGQSGYSSSGDEADLQELGLTALSLPGSMCRTPIDDVLNLMVEMPGVGPYADVQP